MLTGIFSTLLIKETKQLSLEELSNEDQRRFIGGVATVVPVALEPHARKAKDRAAAEPSVQELSPAPASYGDLVDP